MDLLEKKEHYCFLFDFYGELLTPKQQQYFKDYYFADMSLSEIANSYEISRNAVFDQLQKTNQLLEKYETILQLLNKYQTLNQVLEHYSQSNNSEVLELIKKIKELE